MRDGPRIPAWYTIGLFQASGRQEKLRRILRCPGTPGFRADQGSIKVLTDDICRTMLHLSHTMPKPKTYSTLLTRREREIMNAVFALDNRASADEIRARLTNAPGDSAVRVMLARLEKKGFLKHEYGRSALYLFRHNLAGSRETHGITAVCTDVFRWLPAPDDDSSCSRGVMD